jgi:predicted amidohydrolase
LGGDHDVIAPLRIGAAQPTTTPYEVAANAQSHAALVRAADSRVVVFPELSLTGYHLDAPHVSPDDSVLDPLIEACRDTGSVALAGAPIAGDHIAMLVITGEQVSVAYRKIWLGDAEAERFRPGAEPASIDIDGWRLGLAICKDTGAPEHATRTAALGIDVYVAGMLEHLADRDVIGERARRVAQDHHVWVVVASFAGATGEGYDNAAGDSAIWNPAGSLMASAGRKPGEAAVATLTRVKP